MLLITILAIPLIGVVLLVLTRNISVGKSINKHINIPLISSLALLVASFWLRGAFQGGEITYTIKLSGLFSPTLSVDALSALFIILSAFLWVVVSIYTPKYMEHEGKVWGFQLCTLLTLFAVIGIFSAGDLLTMLLFFEFMTISSYFWVIHRWDKEATRAGYFYLFFSIVGGLLLALGIVVMGEAVEVLPKIGSGAVAAINPELFAVSIAIFVIGFGIKAGMVPLHIWLPHAHSVAPTPGSALLSGLLIKVGAYGLIRVGEFAGWGTKIVSGVTWLGSAFIVLGISTMLLGVASALLQSNAKKLLAYHSVSQMGYIILGLGVGLYLGADGGFGLSGAVYHIINHALFKIALFLGVGIIYIHTGETDLYKLGGLWRRFPITAVLMLFAVLGITGAPGLNGYVSKSLLHHGVSQAAGMGEVWLVWIERLFLIVGVGTAASFSKLYYLMFLGKPTKLKIKDNYSFSLRFAMVILAVVMIGIGINPLFLLNTAIVPAVEALGIQNISTTLTGISFWGFKDILEMIVTLIIGALVCFAGLKTGAFHWQPPVWLTIEGGVKLIFGRITAVGQISRKLYCSLKKSITHRGKLLNLQVFNDLYKFDQSKSSTVFGIKLIGISADIGILVFVLSLLIALFVFVK